MSFIRLQEKIIFSPENLSSIFLFFRWWVGSYHILIIQVRICFFYSHKFAINSIIIDYLKHRIPFIMQRSFSVLITVIFLYGCVPPRYSYDEAVIAKTLSSGDKTSIRVSAAVEDWRNSGINVKMGTTYNISATGKWRTYGTCNFTSPDGIGLYKDWCVNTLSLPPVIKGFSHSTLIAKIDIHGIPFIVGNKLEFTAQREGSLFFKINDTFGYSGDNEGYVNVTIQSLAKSPKDVLIAGKNFNKPKHVAVISPLSSRPKIIQQLTAKRTALVIDNSNYAFSPLKNPVNDAKSIAESMTILGFDVELLLDANQQKMEQAIDRFGRKLLNDKHVALFYYAGHGIQINGENYLIPLAAIIKRQIDVRYKAVNIGQILGTMGEASENLNIVILDACRDNPLPRSFRSSSQGLARVEGPKGTIIGFATSPGSVASDGEGDNGVYTKHFLKSMNIPGISIEEVFKRVLQGVNQETGGQQIPWTESSFTGNFSFRSE